MKLERTNNLVQIKQIAFTKMSFKEMYYVPIRQGQLFWSWNFIRPYIRFVLLINIFCTMHPHT